MSRYEKKMKDKLDDEIKLAGLESLVPEELQKHLIFNSNRLRTFEDARLEVVTYVEAKFGLRIRDSKPVTRVRVDIQIPWILMRSILSRLAREKGHRVHVMGVFKCSGAHFQRDCDARKNKGKQSSGKGKQSKSWSKSEGKGKSKENKGKSKGKSKGNKGSHKGETSKIGLSGLRNSKSEASSDTQESAQTCPKDTSRNDGWNGDEWNDGWSIDELNDDWSSVGWHEGWEQTYDTSASSFSLGGLDLGATRSPKRFEWVKMNLDKGAAVNTFPFVQREQEMQDSIGLPVANGFLTEEAWQFQGYGEKRIAQISEWKTHWCAQGVVQCCRDRVQRTTRFLPRTRWWVHDSDSPQNLSGNENSF